MLCAIAGTRQSPNNFRLPHFLCNEFFQKTIFRKKAIKITGVTFIEVLLAAVILALAALPIAGMIGFGHSGTQKDQRYVVGIQLLDETMNRLVALPYKKLYDFTTLAGGKANITGSALNLEFGDLTRSGTNYNVTAVLEIIPTVYFTYRRIDLPNSLNYAWANPSTWVFKNTIDSLSASGKIIRVSVKVKWTEFGGKFQKSVDAMSYSVDLGF
ncbi:MAG: hypothetical protein HQM08_03780 [Candidatus Riflebacteria bacterium]|nr:hypothetical protein [Candidatus Riflebacteria bacterium]